MSGKVKVLLALLLFGVLSLAIRVAIQKMSIEESTEKLNAYKKELFEKDSLRQVRDGHYQKLVYDLSSQSELHNLLKKENESLYNYIDIQKKKLQSVTRINATLKKKKGFIPFYQKKDTCDSFKIMDFYPDADKPFITYTAEVSDTLTYGEFSFGNLKLDLIVSEKEYGVFEVDMLAPSWVSIHSVDVRSLPLKKPKPDNFDWYAGGALGVNILNQRPAFNLEGGFRYKKSLLGVQGTNHGEVLLGYKKMF